MENSAISWTDHTFNPWMGCTKVSEACKFCYAERDMDHRYGKVQWGPSGTRVLTSDANWRKPLKWNREAEHAARSYADHAHRVAGDLSIPLEGPPHRPRVFCASLADVFEDWTGPVVDSHGRELWLAPVEPDRFVPRTDRELLPIEQANIDAGVFRPVTLQDVRRRLFRMIDATPWLDWLLLTKRPENIAKFWPARVLNANADGQGHDETTNYRENVWLGTSVENQERADARIPELLKCRDLARVLFLSCEPLLGPVDLTRIKSWHPVHGPDGADALSGGSWGHPMVRRLAGQDSPGYCNHSDAPTVDWVIAGGESGPKARPSHPDWFRSLRDQCAAAGVAFHFKQWGEWGADAINVQTGAPVVRQFTSHIQWVNKASTWVNGGTCVDTAGNVLTNGKGFREADEGGRFPVAILHRVGTKQSGHLLDGREHLEFPAAMEASAS